MRTVKTKNKRSIAILGGCLLVLLGCDQTQTLTSQASANSDDKKATVAVKSNTLEEIWGVNIIGVRLTALNKMLDFRYRVLDAKKAAPLLDRKIKPHLIVEKNNTKLFVPFTPKLGSLRQSSTHPKAERSYFMFFQNMGQVVHAGDKVTVAIGDFEARHIVVQ